MRFLCRNNWSQKLNCEFISLYMLYITETITTKLVVLKLTVCQTVRRSVSGTWWQQVSRSNQQQMSDAFSWLRSLGRFTVRLHQLGEILQVRVLILLG